MERQQAFPAAIPARYVCHLDASDLLDTGLWPKAPVAIWRWPLITTRVAAMLGWTGLAVPIHLFVLLIGKRWAVPPVYLTGLGWIAGMKVRVSGRPHPRALLLGNHLSWLDILALAGTARSNFVAHDGVAGHPVIKWLSEQNGTIFISRDRRHTVAGQVEQVRQALGARTVTIFLEGTTGNGQTLLPFKSSLLSAVEPLPAGLPVQPVALLFDEAHHIAWVGDEPGLVNAFKILGRVRPVRLELRFLEPLSGPALADRKSMAAAAREAIERELGLQKPSGLP